MKGLRKWQWDVLPTYNGFTFVERVRGWQAIHFLIDNGWAQRSNVCCISGDMNMPRLHSENYYSWEPYTLAHSIHMALHNRFRHPDAWRRIVQRYALTGDEWFARLPLEPVDLAGALRAKHGSDIADIFDRLPLPAGLTVPRHQIYRQPSAAVSSQ
ncbi:hypothetical protein LZK73_15235 [Neorhizobium galegae]|nr:hypothetical protein LZK73_15235 [Neorhizobium galegae]